MRFFSWLTTIFFAAAVSWAASEAAPLAEPSDAAVEASDPSDPSDLSDLSEEPEAAEAAEAPEDPALWDSGDWFRHTLRSSALAAFEFMAQPAAPLSPLGLEALPSQGAASTNLIAGLTQSNDPLVRADAFEAWVVQTTAQDLDSLVAASLDSNPAVRRSVETALLRIAAAEPGTFRNYVLAAFSGRYPAAAAGLDPLLPSLEEALNLPLRELLADPTQSSENRRTAAYILGRTQDPDAVPLLLDAVRSEDVWLAVAAAQALHSLRLPHLVPEWVAMLEHAQPGIQQLAVSGLATLGGEEAFSVLAQLALGQRAAPATLQTQALYALAQWPVADAVPVLTEVATVNLRLRNTARRLISALTGVPLDLQQESAQETGTPPMTPSMPGF